MNFLLHLKTQNVSSNAQSVTIWVVLPDKKYSVQDPTQPIFVCKSWKRQSTSYEVHQVLCSTIGMDVNSQQAIEPSTNFQQPETSDPRDKLIAQLT
jgi:hypothetical protein